MKCSVKSKRCLVLWITLPIEKIVNAKQITDEKDSNVRWDTRGWYLCLPSGRMRLLLAINFCSVS